MLALRWRNKRDVYILSTNHAIVELTEVDWTWRINNIRRHWSPTVWLNIIKEWLELISKIKCWPVPLLRENSWKAIENFFFTCLTWLCLIHISWRKKNTQSRKIDDYRINITETILKHVQLPDYTRHGTSSQGITPLRLQAILKPFFKAYWYNTSKKTQLIHVKFAINRKKMKRDELGMHKM